MLKLDWLKDGDNVAYVDANEFIDNFEKEAGISKLRQAIEEFVANPTAEGRTVTGTKRTAVKIFIPDVSFDEHIEMGENHGYSWESTILLTVSTVCRKSKQVDIKTKTFA